VPGAPSSASKLRGNLKQEIEMDAKELDQHFRRYLECLNARKIDQLDEFVHESIRYNGAPMTRGEWKAGPILGTLDAMPDFRWTIGEILIEGDRIAARLTDTGTLAREWLGLRPTGRSVAFTEMVFYTFTDGRMSEIWSVFDAVGMKAQLKGQ
jgi:predicted ester cyclase